MKPPAFSCMLAIPIAVRNRAYMEIPRQSGNYKRSQLDAAAAWFLHLVSAGGGYENIRAMSSAAIARISAGTSITSSIASTNPTPSARLCRNGKSAASHAPIQIGIGVE